MDASNEPAVARLDDDMNVVLLPTASEPFGSNFVSKNSVSANVQAMVVGQALVEGIVNGLGVPSIDQSALNNYTIETHDAQTIRLMMLKTQLNHVADSSVQYYHLLQAIYDTEKWLDGSPYKGQKTPGATMWMQAKAQAQKIFDLDVLPEAMDNLKKPQVSASHFHLAKKNEDG